MACALSTSLVIYRGLVLYRRRLCSIAGCALSTAVLYRRLCSIDGLCSIDDACALSTACALSMACRRLVLYQRLRLVLCRWLVLYRQCLCSIDGLLLSLSADRLLSAEELWLLVSAVAVALWRCGCVVASRFGVAMAADLRSV